jgi:hypothetical protein
MHGRHDHAPVAACTSMSADMKPTYIYIHTCSLYASALVAIPTADTVNRQHGQHAKRGSQRPIAGLCGLSSCRDSCGACHRTIYDLDISRIYGMIMGHSDRETCTSGCSSQQLAEIRRDMSAGPSFRDMPSDRHQSHQSAAWLIALTSADHCPGS